MLNIICLWPFCVIVFQTKCVLRNAHISFQVRVGLEVTYMYITYTFDSIRKH